MAYDVHITRAEDWLTSEEAPIPLEEWLKLVDQDPEMRREEVAVGRVKGKPAVTYQSSGLAVWTAYSGHDPQGNMAWFDHTGGRVVVKNPDDEIRRKMAALAKKLGANVVGDEGEYYYQSKQPKSQAKAKTKPAQEKKSKPATPRKKTKAKRPKRK